MLKYFNKKKTFYLTFYFLLLLIYSNNVRSQAYIYGPFEVCPGVPYEYSLSGLTIGCTLTYVAWEPYGGTVTATSLGGRKATVVWSSGISRSISASYEYSNCNDLANGTPNYKVTIRPNPTTPTSLITKVQNDIGEKIETVNFCGGGTVFLETNPTSDGYTYEYLWERSINNVLPFELFSTTTTNTTTFSVPILTPKTGGHDIKFRVKRRYKDCPNMVTGYKTTPSCFIFSKAPTMTATTNPGICTKRGTITISNIVGTSTKYKLELAGQQGFEVPSTGGTYSLPNGSYTYQFSNFDGSSCSSSGSFTISSTTITLSLSISNLRNISCFNKKDGRATFSISNGTPNYTFTLEKPGGLPNQSLTTSSSSWTIDTLSQGGDYYISAIDVNGCSSSRQKFTIIKPAELKVSNPSTDITATNVTCHGKSDGAITIKNIIGGTVFSTDYYLVNLYLNGESKGGPRKTNKNLADGYNVKFDTLGPGNYTIKITDQNLCAYLYPVSPTPQITITEPSAITIAGSGSTNLTCFERNNGTIKIKATNDFPLTYQLNGVALDGTIYSNRSSNGTDADGFVIFSGLRASNLEGYKIKISNSTCFINSNSFQITQPGEITVAASSKTHPTCNEGSNGSITIKASGGSGNLTFTLTGYRYDNTSVGSIVKTGAQAVDVVFSGLHASDADGYSISIKDTQNCLIEEAPIFILTHPSSITKTSSSKANNLCFGNNLGSITFLAQGGTGNLTYTLTGNNYLNQAVSFTQTKAPGTSALFSNLSASSANGYTISVTDANSCTPFVENNITITQPTELTLSNSTSTSVTCGGGSNGSLAVSASGGVSPYYISIDNGVTWSAGTSKSGLRAGVYTVLIKDTNACTKTQNITITEPTLLTITGTEKIDDNCNRSIARASVSGTGGVSPYTYSWKPQGSNEVISTTSSISNVLAGNYIATLTDSKGCTANQTISISNIGGAGASIQDVIKTDLSCFESNNGSIKIKATDSHPLTYELNGASIDGTTYDKLSPSNLNENGYAVFSNLRASSALGYKIKITNSQNCARISDAFIITQPNKIDTLSTAVENVTCFGKSDGKITVKASGGTGSLTYTLSGKKYNGESIANIVKLGNQATDFIFTGLQASNAEGYSLMINDANLCSGTDIIYHVTQPALVSIDHYQVEHNGCYGDGKGSLKVGASGGVGNLIYSLSGKNYLNGEVSIIQSKSQGSLALFSNLKASNSLGYSITVTDAMGCKSEVKSNILINHPTELVITESIATDVKCFGENNGAVNLIVTGGATPYYISSDNGTTWTEGTSLHNLVAGSYEVAIKDNNSCIKYHVFSISQPLLFQITSVDKEDATCGVASGNATIVASGGRSPYSYSWISQQNKEVISTTSSASNLLYGKYLAVVTDANNCTINHEVTINNSGGPAVNFINILSSSCNNVNDGAAEITFTSHSDIIKGVIWPNGSTGYKASGLASGVNEVIVKTEGCYYNYYVTIPTSPPISLLAYKKQNPLCFGECNGSIEVSATGGTGVYTFVWEGGKSGAKIDGLCAGNYKVQISDEQGCFSYFSFELINPTQLSVDLPEEAVQCSSMMQILDAGNPGSTYLWTSDNGFTSTERIVEIDKAGIYTVKVTNRNGCVAVDNFKLTVNNTLLSSDFLMSSEGYAGDTILLVEISWPYGESLSWVYDQKVKKHSSEGSFEQLIFPEPGIYAITLNTTLGDCKASVTKKITIYDRKDTIIEVGFLGYAGPYIKTLTSYPNPNNGIFITNIELREKNKIDLKIFNAHNSEAVIYRSDQGSDSYQYEFNLSNLAKGVYIMVLKAGKEVKTQRIIIN